MKNNLLAALDLALTVVFIVGGLLLLAVGIWLTVANHDISTGVVLGVIGALLAGTPLSRLRGVGGVSRTERRMQWFYRRTGVTPPSENSSGMQTTFDDD